MNTTIIRSEEVSEVAKTKHVIWSNLDLDLDDWRDDLIAEYLHIDADDEDALTA